MSVSTLFNFCYFFFLSEFTGFVNRIADLTNANLDALRVGKQSWANQFREALNVNGGDLETATAFSYLLHFMTFGFKASILKFNTEIKEFPIISGAK